VREERRGRIVTSVPFRRSSFSTSPPPKEERFRFSRARGTPS
jgi:hypothetical protein